MNDKPGFGLFSLRRLGSEFCRFLVVFWLGSCAAAGIPFQEVTDAAGVGYSGGFWGVACGDFNGDGLPDIWVGNHLEPSNLYVNQGDGAFIDVADEVVPAGRDGDDHGVAWADFDNDGDQDLMELVGAEKGHGQGPSHLFVSTGGVLVDEAPFRGVDYPLGRGRAPLWLDYDNDGRLDLLMANLARSDQLAETAVLFRQTETGSFVNVRDTAGITLKSSNHFAQLADLTGDGKAELIVQSFSTPYPQAVYEMSTVPFKDITQSIGIPRFNKVADTAIMDFNGDLRQDLYLCRRHPAEATAADGDLLLLATPLGFTSKKMKLEPDGSQCSSVAAGDFDNDMDVDLVVLSGNPVTKLDTSDYLRNRGNGKFWHYRFNLPEPPRDRNIVVVLDYNADGFLDLFVSAFHHHLYKNMGSIRGNRNSWIEIDLEGVQSNRDGIGAQVFVTAGGVTQVREQGGGMHLFAQNHSRIHFGLGQNNTVDNITVLWPSGMRQELANVPANQIIRIVESQKQINAVWIQ